MELQWWSPLNAASGICNLVHFVRTKLEDGYLSMKNEETRAEKLVVLDTINCTSFTQDSATISINDLAAISGDAASYELLRERGDVDELSSR